MSILAERTSIVAKTKELCAQIAEDEKFKELQNDVATFLDDEKAKLQYQEVHKKGEELHQKQHAGVELSPTEIKTFESARDQLFENKVASGFMEAQRTLETMQKEIGKYIGMTMELGRVPTDEELVEPSNEGGCCGGSGGGEGGCCS